MPDVHICDIVESSPLTKHAHSITVSSAEIASQSEAGQFLHVKCGDSHILRRPLGVCEASGEYVRFVFEVKGQGTLWLSKRIRGDKLDILGPLGAGFKMPQGKIVIVGGGLGVPPMLYAAKSAKYGAVAILGFREFGRVMLTDEFMAVCDKVIVTTDDGSHGERGTVAGPLGRLLAEGGHAGVLACGQLAMQRSVAEICREHGVPCQVSLEERMGCGVGACLVCACRTVKDGTEKMSMVCKDGPVFDAREVVWENG